MKYLFSFLLLTLALILEVSSFSLPLVFVVLVAVSVVLKDNFSFFAAVLFGLLLDVLTFQTIGITSAFFTILVFIIFSYQKKFEITTNYFVVFSCFLASVCFILLYGYSNLILGSLVSVLVGLLVFNILLKTNRQQITNLKSQITNKF